MARPSTLASSGRPALILNGGRSIQDNGHLGISGLQVTSRSISELAFSIQGRSVQVRETVGDRDLADFALVQVAAFRTRQLPC